MLAQKVMDGDYQLRPCSPASPDKRLMLNLLRGDDSEPASLVEALKKFVTLLQGSEELVRHVQHAKAAVGHLLDSLERTDTIEWERLRRTVDSRFIVSGELPDFNLEGVTVWREFQEVWRPVKHLIVLGFTKGHYPATPSNDSVFSADDLQSISECMNLAVSTPMDVQEGQRKRFKRQLSGVSESVTFLVSRHSPNGERQSPSDSMVFMHQLFKRSERKNTRTRHCC